MSLKLLSAKRVETGGHHLSDYLLSCSCAAVLDSLRGEMTAILIFVRLSGMWQCDAESGGDCPKSQTFLSDNRESAFGLG